MNVTSQILNPNPKPYTLISEPLTLYPTIIGFGRHIRDTNESDAGGGGDALGRFLQLGWHEQPRLRNSATRHIHFSSKTQPITDSKIA